MDPSTLAPLRRLMGYTRYVLCVLLSGHVLRFGSRLCGLGLRPVILKAED